MLCGKADCAGSQRVNPRLDTVFGKAPFPPHRCYRAVVLLLMLRFALTHISGVWQPYIKLFSDCHLSP
jgi:hypothetical protein